MARRVSRRAQRQDPNQRVREGQDKADNKMAAQAIVISLVAVALLFTIITLAGSDDETKPDRKKRRTAPDPIGKDLRPEAPDKESEVPLWLATQFMLHLAQENPDEIEKLFWWEKIFEKIDSQNKIDGGQTYADSDEAEKSRRREKYLFKVMDPDYVELTREYLLDQLLANRTQTIWGNTWDIQPDYGNISVAVKDERDKLRLEVLVKTELLTGFDSRRDAQNKSAWKIVGLAHEQRGKVNEFGKATYTRRKDFGDGFYKKPRAKKTNRGPAGPREADPAPVAWIEGTSADMKAKISGFAQKMNDQSDIRAADQAKFQLIALGKTAIPGILTAIASQDYKADAAGIGRTFQLVQALEEITGVKFTYAPAPGRQGFGMSGMTKQTPEERAVAIRRWFGWWQTSGPTWTKKAESAEDETWEDFDDEEDGKKKKGN